MLKAVSGDIHTNQATWSVNDLLDIHTPNTFSTVGSELVAGQWKVSAARVDNQSGRWFGNSLDSLRLDLHKGLNNQGGVIQNRGNIDIQSHKADMDNRQGVIKSLSGSISTQSQTQLQNEQGKFVAAQNITLNHSGLNNQQGYALAQTGNITLTLQDKALNNQQGDILAGKNLSVSGSAVTNLKGTLYGGDNTTIHTHSGHLNNQENGQILAGNEMTVDTQNLFNDSGIIRAGNNATFTIAEQLDNNKTTINSLIQAGNTLSIMAQQVSNRKTKTTTALPESGLVAGTINLKTPTLDNQQGGIYSIQQSKLEITNLLANLQGEIRSTGNLDISGTALSIENQQGQLSSLGRLSVTADKLSSFGLISGGETQLNLVQGLTSHSDILGRNHLAITTQGEFTNLATLYSEGKVSLNALNIDNRG